jgi:predicted RNA binding protein YcfA (HicA-like mRNA interferase family)
LADDFEQLFATVAAAVANTKFETLVKLMESVGFEMRIGKKHHAIFTHRAYGLRQNVAIRHHGPMKPVYVRECIKILEKFQMLQGNTDA